MEDVNLYVNHINKKKHPVRHLILKILRIFLERK